MVSKADMPGMEFRTVSVSDPKLVVSKAYPHPLTQICFRVKLMYNIYSCTLACVAKT